MTLWLSDLCQRRLQLPAVSEVENMSHLRWIERTVYSVETAKIQHSCDGQKDMRRRVGRDLGRQRKRSICSYPTEWAVEAGQHWTRHDSLFAEKIGDGRFFF